MPWDGLCMLSPCTSLTLLCGHVVRLQIDADVDRLAKEIRMVFLSAQGVLASSDSELGEWDRQRAEIVRHCIERIVVPKFTTELRNKLRKDASEAVTEEYARALRRRALQRPVPAIDDLEGELGSRKASVPSVVAVGLTDESSLADYAVGIDADGHVRAGRP